MNKLVSGAIGVEIKLKSNNAQIFLPDVIDLRNKRIKHIDVITNSISDVTPSGTPILELYRAEKLFITLRETNTQSELIRDLPLTELSPKSNRLFINKIIDLQRSYITVSGDVSNYALYLVFWYDEPKIWGVINTTERTAIQPIELKLTGTRTYFAENRDMLNKRVQNLLLSFPYYTPNGNLGLSKGNERNKFLTLQRNGLQFFQQVPINLFFQTDLNYQLRLQNIVWDFQNSYIETVGTTADDLKTVFFNAIIDDSKNTRR